MANQSVQSDNCRCGRVEVKLDCPSEADSSRLMQEARKLNVSD